ncbi:hypothetical protein BLNAU_3118 [Blattamonas nauphoetae]|uniref:Uncharacterized protein n=1 Tax=Blattamonas nauphoetae TaxID=2049346 RepID=A0ABQ9YE97_9EUKA|nr:hypothetical protein BLNAU_3118 [Blattamonas nauphoetae]
MTIKTQTPTGITPDATLTSTSFNISSFQFCSEQGLFANHIQPEDTSSFPPISVTCSASAFHNISSLHATHRTPPQSTQVPKYLLSGISYTDSENGFYGLLTPNINLGGDFLFTNSTFSRCSVDATGQTYTASTPRFELDSTSSFTNCNFTEMTSTEDGGAIYFNNPSGTLSVTGCNFTDCTVSTSSILGGAIYVAHATYLSMENTRFVGCKSGDGYGGGFAVFRTATVILDTITCDTCEALTTSGLDCRGGGGMLYQASTLILSNSQFLNCVSDALGGGFAFYSISSSSEISSTQFTSCQSKGNGGGIDLAYCASPSTITLTTVIFTDCEVSLDDNGGGLSAKTSNKIVLNTCQFITCSAKGNYKYGGGCFFETITTIEVKGSTFQDCVANDGFGGGLSFEEGGSLSVTDSFFTRCLAKSNQSHGDPADARGGGIRVTTASGKVYLNKVTFVGCEAAKEGGGLFVDDIGQLEMTSCDFTDCQVEDDSLYNCFGGAVLTTNVAGANTITQCKFTECYSELRGGAIYADDTPSLTVDDCDFDTCIAYRYGGGTCTFEVPTIEIKNSRFVACTARWGGGVYEEYKSGTMISITVSGNNFTECNTAQEHGGAVWIENYPATQILTNNIIKQCMSTGDGGGIAIPNGQDVTITDSQFISCSSTQQGGGLAINDAEDVTLADSQFTSCVSADSGGGVYFMMSQGHFTISCCVVKSCQGNRFGGGIFLGLGAGSTTFLIDSVGYGRMPEDMNTVVDGEYGSNLFFDLIGRSDASIINPNTVKDPLIMMPANGISFTEDELKKWAYRTDYWPTFSFIYLIHPYVGGSLAVSSTQYHDASVCGYRYLPCQDFTVGHANAKDSATGEKAGVFIHTDVTATPPSFDKDMIWESSESNPKSLTISSGSVSPGLYSLTMKSLALSRTLPGASLFSITTGSLSVTSCTFTGRSSTTNGGAISATITTNTLTIASSSFKKWITEGNGGGIFIDATGLGSGGGFDVSGCLFGTGGDKNSATRGDNVNVSGKDFGTLITTARFPSVSGSTSPTLYWGNDVTHSVDSTLLVYLVPIGSTAAVDSLSGKAIQHCGHFGVACPMIETGFSRISGNVSPLSLELSSSVTAGAGFSVSSGKEISIKKSSASTQSSSSNTNPVLTFISSTSFTISSGKLSFEELELEVKVTTTTNAFVVAGGTLELGTSCSLSFSGTSGSLISQTNSLIKVSGGTLKIAGTSGSPKEIEYVDMRSSSVIEVNGVDFSGTVDLSFLTIGHCKSSSHGMISFLSSPSSSSVPTVSIDDCFFNLNENSNAVIGPHDIEADASWESVLDSPLVFVETYSDSTVNHFQIGTSDKSSLVPFPILKTHGTDAGADADCNLNTIMCKTVKTSLSHCTQKSGSIFVKREIQMETGTFSEDTLVVGEKNVEIRGKTAAVILQPSSDVSLLTLSSGTAELTTFKLAAFTTQSDPVIVVTDAGGKLSLSAISFDGSGKTLSDSVVSTEGTTTVTDCYFSDITAQTSTTNGGAISATITTNTLTIASSSFKKWITEGNGGGIFIDATGLGSGGGFDVSGCLFGTGGDKNSATRGDNVYVSGKDFGTLITTARFPSVSGSTSPTLYWGNDVTHSVDSTLLVYLVPIGSTAAVDSLSGKAIQHCGHFGVACQTIESGFNRISENASPLSLELTSSVTAGAGLSITSGQALVINSSPPETHSLNLSPSTTFVVVSSTLTFSNIFITFPSSSVSHVFDVSEGDLSLHSTVSFLTPSSQSPFNSDVFNLRSGTIATTGTQFNFNTPLSLNGASLINVQSANLILTQTSFSNIVSSGDSAALHATVTSNTLTIDRSSFKKCESSKRGGAILLNLVQMTGNGDYKLLGIDFGRGESRNLATLVGHDVFVIGGALEDLITFERWTGSLSEATDDDLMGLDNDTPPFVSLLPFLIGNMFIVGEGGSDVGSGTDSSPFLTLWKGLTEALVVEKEAMGIVIKGQARIGQVVESGGDDEQAKTITIEGAQEGCRILCSVKDEEEGRRRERREAMILIRKHSFEISNLILSSFTPSSSVNSIFELRQKGSLTLIGCRIDGQSGISQTITTVGSEGRVVLSFFRTQNVDFIGKGGIVKCNGDAEVSMDNCDFSSTSFEDGAVVWGRTTAGLKLHSSRFSACLRKNFGSLVRLRIVGCVGEVKGCTFINCRTEVRMDEKSGVGGGCVVMEMDKRTTHTRHMPRSSVDLSESVFDSCQLLCTQNPASKRCVGGSGFLVVGKERSDWVSLRDATVSNCVCSDVEDGKGFEGGVVGWTEAPVQSDRRGMKTTPKQVGSLRI